MSPSARIVATVGSPGSPAYDHLEDMLGFGTVRINLAYTGPDRYEEHRELIRRMRKRRGDNLCILLDCVGPRAKLGPLPRTGIDLVGGSEVTITTRDVKAEPGILPTVFEALPDLVRPDQPILMAEGEMVVEVLSVEQGTDVRCRVVRGGVLRKRGINLSETEIRVPALSKRDQRDLGEMIDEDFDMVALSFVRSVTDIEKLRQFLDDHRRPDVRIMAKIETRQAVERIDEIADCCDALMVARGDLWAELDNHWELPRVTLRIIRAANERGIPVVTATQALASMTDHDTPRRAEVDALYFLLHSGSDAIMGSEEFTIGRHPRAVIEAIRSVSREVDRDRLELLRSESEGPSWPKPTAFDSWKAVIAWAEGTEQVRCVVVISSQGWHALQIHRHRSRKPLVVITNRSSTARYMQLLGVYGIRVDYSSEDKDPRKIAHVGLGALGWRSTGQTALLIMDQEVSPERHYSKIEEIPLPN
jgi:pyruvate kinase